MNPSLKRLEKDKDRARSLKDWKKLAEFCNAKGSELFNSGEYEEALQEHMEALTLFTSLGDPLDTAVAHRSIGECLAQLGRYIEGVEHLTKYLRLAESVGSLVEQQRAWATLGRTYVSAQADKTGEKKLRLLQKAEKAYLKSMEFTEKLKSELSVKEIAEMEGRLFQNIGLVHDERKDRNAAASYLQKALTIFHEHSLSEDRCRCLIILSMVYMSAKNSSLAIQASNSALEVARTLKNKHYKCEAYEAKGQAAVFVEDFEEGIHSFKKAYQQCNHNILDKQRYEIFLKVSLRLQEWNLNLKLCNKNARVELYERLGDGMIQFNFLLKAVKYYHLALNMKEEVDIPEKKLADINFSLAKTYEDAEDLNLAIKYYIEELNLRKNDPVESCSTLQTVAKLKLKTEATFVDVEKTLQEALKYAEISGKSYLKKECLEGLFKLYRAAKMDQKNDIMLKLMEIKEDAEDMDSENSQILDQFAEVSVSDLSAASDSDPEMGDVPGRRLRKRLEDKKNDLGESPLQQACFEGDYKRAKDLILKMNHPVNVRDHSGWTPLHEACANGHFEIVKLLVENGANVNDLGTEGTCYITPLHDAAMSGAVDIMRYLIEKGASIHSQTMNGETILDYFIKGKEEADSGDEDELLKMEKYLRENLKVKSSNQKIVVKSEEHFCEIKQDPVTGNLDTMEETTVDKKVPMVPTAYIAEHEPWLDDDLQSGKKMKRKRMFQTKLSLTSTREQTVSRKRTKFNNRSAAVKRSIDLTESENDEAEDCPKISHVTDESSTTSTLEPQETTTLPKAASSHQKNVISNSLKVKIEGTVIFVPIKDSDCNQSSDWLAKAVADRYYRLNNFQPVVQITLSDGAVLSPTDPISCLFHYSGEIVGKVLSWNLPELSERYKNTCQNASVEPSEHLIPLLEHCEKLGELNFNVIAQHERFDLIFQSLKHQSNLRKINIVCCSLSISDVKFLFSCLPTAHNLQFFYLDTCMLTAKHLQCIENSLNDVTLHIRELSINYNPIRNDGARSLSYILSTMPNLKALRLAGCLLTGSGIKIALCKLHTLEELDISSNNIVDTGLETVFSAISQNPLLKLNLSNCVPSLAKGTGKHLYKFLSRPECVLKVLNISCCLLKDEDAAELQNVITNECTLEEIKISVNLGLSAKAVDDLICVLSTQIKSLCLEGYSNYLETESLSF